MSEVLQKSNLPHTNTFPIISCKLEFTHNHRVCQKWPQFWRPLNRKGENTFTQFHLSRLKGTLSVSHEVSHFYHSLCTHIIWFFKLIRHFFTNSAFMIFAYIFLKANGYLNTNYTFQKMTCKAKHIAIKYFISFFKTQQPIKIGSITLL